MHVWKETYDPKTKSRVHSIEPGLGHAWLGAIVGFTFKTLRVSAAIWNQDLWSPIHDEPNVSRFELEHGMDPLRYAYNQRMIEEALSRKAMVQGEFAGYSDLFCPIIVQGGAIGVLISGPFARSRPTSADVAQRWKWLTGHEGHPSDPEFVSYLQATLSMLVLEGKLPQRFARLLDIFSQLIAGRGEADALGSEADELRVELEEARAVDVMWERVRVMVNERSSHVWHSSSSAFGLEMAGLSRVPDHVMVGLTLGKESDADPIEAAIRRDAFQRGCVELALRTGGMFAGRVGDHGVVFVCSPKGSPTARAQSLTSIAEKASTLARTRYGLTLRTGLSVISRSEPLSAGFLAALGAAQTALMQSKRSVTASPGGRRASYSLRPLHEELARVAEEQPELLAVRFDPYLEAVGSHSGYRLEVARAHLEMGFERMADAASKSGTLDPKSLATMLQALERAAAEATTIHELFDAHRRAAAELGKARERPVSARHDRNLRGALDYIHAHYAEPLSLSKVAKVAGFNASYFSELFAKRERMPFERYVRGLRVERAKQLLVGSMQDVARVAELSGFHSPEYFARVFKAAVGVTPRAYRLKRRDEIRQVKRTWKRR